MIIVTGAAGFIGSCLVNKLNNKGHKDIILVDDFKKIHKKPNYEKKIYSKLIERTEFFPWLDKHYKDIEGVYHIGARTDTAEFDMRVFEDLNISYSKAMWEACSKYSIPLIYASSAATYGMGEYGYKDEHSIVPMLKPLNPYGISKNEFDKWMLNKKEQPPFWAGMKFFNVYGPNEYHKERMASVIFHAYNQIQKNGGVKLFKSHHPDYEDGKQLRDFIYVKDVTDVMYFLMQSKPESGLYNLGTGQARSFLDLARAVFKAMNLKENITFIDTPEDIRDKYQYFTEADMTKLRNTAYYKPFYSLESGIEEYVQEYLIKSRHA